MATGFYALLHFLVDGVCALSMFGYFATRENWYVHILLYNFCAFAMQMPTVVVAAGFIEEADTIVRLSPVALTERPRRVFRKNMSAADTQTVMMPDKITLEYEARASGKMPSNSENTVSTLRSGTLDLPPIALRLIE